MMDIVHPMRRTKDPEFEPLAEFEFEEEGGEDRRDDSNYAQAEDPDPQVGDPGYSQSRHSSRRSRRGSSSRTADSADRRSAPEQAYVRQHRHRARTHTQPGSSGAEKEEPRKDTRVARGPASVLSPLTGHSTTTLESVPECDESGEYVSSDEYPQDQVESG
jgi:hypothetical protein